MRPSFLIAAGVAVAYVAAGWSTLSHGHPAEDAYILFKYANNLAAGEGYVFYPGGPRVEAPIDFAWLLLMAGLVRLGADPPLAAIGLNALAAGAAAALCLRVVDFDALPNSKRWPYALASFAVLVTPCALAGYVGFSSMLFATSTLALYAAFLGGRRGMIALPALALCSGLVRPEGLIVGGAFCTLAIPRARSLGALRQFLSVAAATFLAGAAYYAARFAYFGRPLPLPLYVKSHSQHTLAGLPGNLLWLEHEAPSLLAIALFAFLFRPAERGRVLTGLIPFGALLAALLYPDQVQNVAGRFQSPASLALLFALFALSKGASRWRIPLFLAAIAVVGVRGLSLADEAVRKLGAPDYIDWFAKALGTRVDAGTTIALTEAGRIPYWNDAKVIDLTGLDTWDTALQPPSPDYLAKLRPDVVMFHHAGQLVLDDLGSGDVVKIDGPLAKWFIAGEQQRAYAEGIASRPYSAIGLSNMHVAPMMATLFLTEHAGEYDIFAVRYAGGWNHVYGFRKSFAPSQGLESLLRESHRRAQGLSYFDLVRRNSP